MGAKKDLKDLDSEDIGLWFEETPTKRYKGSKTSKVAKKPVKQSLNAKNALQGVSSWQLVRELIKRHHPFILTALFWMGLGAIIAILGR